MVSEISKWTNKYTKSKHSVAVNSNGAGIYSILRILKNIIIKTKYFSKVILCMVLELSLYHQG